VRSDRAVLLLGSVILVAACGNDAPPTTPTPAPAAFVRVDIEGPTMHYLGPVGETLQLRAIATMSDGTVSNPMTVTVTAPAAVSVNISPATATVVLKQTRQFTATVTGTSNTSVVWKVNGVTGGNTTVGRVSSNGLYTAPRRVPAPATVAVSATSVADATKSASAQVTITR